MRWKTGGWQRRLLKSSSSRPLVYRQGLPSKCQRANPSRLPHTIDRPPCTRTCLYLTRTSRLAILQQLVAAAAHFLPEEPRQLQQEDLDGVSAPIWLRGVAHHQASVHSTMAGQRALPMNRSEQCHQRWVALAWQELAFLVCRSCLTCLSHCFCTPIKLSSSDERSKRTKMLAEALSSALNPTPTPESLNYVLEPKVNGRTTCFVD